MNAVTYARYSSDSQREESIEGQLVHLTMRRAHARQIIYYAHNTHFSSDLAADLSLK